MKKRITSLFLAFTFIISTVGFISSAAQINPEDQMIQESRDDDRSPEERKEFMENQAEALNIAANIKKEAAKDQYGGMYIDDNGDLNVYKLQDAKQPLTTLEDKNVKIHYAENSLDDLLKANEKILELLMPYVSNGEFVFYLSPNEKTNFTELTIDSSFRDCEDKEIIDVREEIEAIKGAKIIYVDNLEAMEAQANYNVYPGSPIYKNTSSGKRNFSLGYTTKTNNGTVAFVTAGHCIATGESLYSGWAVNKRMGTCHYSIQTAEYDLAFVALENPLFDRWVPKNAGNYSGEVMTYSNEVDNVYNYLIGTECWLEGGGERAYGKVTSTSMSGTQRYYNDNGSYQDRVVRDRIQYNNFSYKSKSGGFVWTWFLNSEGTYTRVIVAIHSGGLDNGYLGQGTKIKYIVELYGRAPIYYEAS